MSAGYQEWRCGICDVGGVGDETKLEAHVATLAHVKQEWNQANREVARYMLWLRDVELRLAALTKEGSMARKTKKSPTKKTRTKAAPAKKTAKRGKR